MFVFELVFVLIILALVVGQSRLVFRAWNTQAAGRRNPASRSEHPARFFINFGFELLLALVALGYSAGLIWRWLT